MDYINKLNKLNDFLLSSGFKKEALILTQSIKDWFFMKNFDDAVDNYYNKSIGISVVDNIGNSAIKIDVMKYCGEESIASARYLKENANEDVLAELDDFIDEIEQFYSESKRDLYSKTLGSQGIENMKDFKGVIESEGMIFESTTIGDYLSEFFYREMDNYCIERENFLSEFMERYCSFVNKTYSALKAKEERSKKMDEYISNVDNACKAYMHLSLDDLNKIYKKYDKNVVLAAASCIMHEGSFYPLYEFSSDKINDLSTNYPELYKYISS